MIGPLRTLVRRAAHVTRARRPSRPAEGGSSQPKPRLFLHVGTHKTGTTAIQKFAANNRRPLERQGLMYPLYGGPRKANESHLALFHRLAGDKSPIRQAAVPAIIEAWVDRARRSQLDVLLSAEAIWRHQLAPQSSSARGGNTWADRRRRYLQTVADALSDFDIQVVMVLRDQDSFITSNYCEHIQKKTKPSELDFGAFCAKQQNTVLRYRHNIELFEQVFGPVIVMRYGDLIENGALTANFFHRLGVNTQRMRTVGRVRRSLSIPEALLKRHLCWRYDLDAKQADQALRDPRLAAILQQSLGACQRFWTSQAERKAFIDAYTDENEWIRARFFSNDSQLFHFSAAPTLAPAEIPPDLDDAVRQVLAHHPVACDP